MDIKEKKHKRCFGFSFVELLIVMCIISIAMAVAIAHYHKYIAQAEIASALRYTNTVKRELLEYYYLVGKWPEDDKQLQDYTGIFSRQRNSDWLNSSSLDRITVNTNGAINVWYNKDCRVQQYVNDPILTLRPVLTKGEGPGTIFWLCGNAKASDNAIVLGKNRTNIPDKFLITNCKLN